MLLPFGQVLHLFFAVRTTLSARWLFLLCLLLRLHFLLDVFLAARLFDFAGFLKHTLELGEFLAPHKGIVFDCFFFVFLNDLIYFLHINLKIVLEVVLFYLIAKVVNICIVLFLEECDLFLYGRYYFSDAIFLGLFLFQPSLFCLMDEIIEESIDFVDSDHSPFIYRLDVGPFLSRNIFQNSAFLHSFVEDACYSLLEFFCPWKHFLYALQLHLDIFWMVLGVLWNASVAEGLKVPHVSNADEADVFLFVFGAFPALRFHCVYMMMIMIK